MQYFIKIKMSKCCEIWDFILYLVIFLDPIYTHFVILNCEWSINVIKSWGLKNRYVKSRWYQGQA
jgi:hypothetical protein